MSLNEVMEARNGIEFYPESPWLRHFQVIHLALMECMFFCLKQGTGI